MGFRQYVRGKPHPWGIKAYVLSESKSGYMYNLVIYYGKETQLLTKSGLNHTTNVVLTLMNPLADLGYDLYTDRFYTSPLLASEVLHSGTTLIGTVMTNRKNMPQAVKSKKQKSGDVDTYSSRPGCGHIFKPSARNNCMHAYRLRKAARCAHTVHYESNSISPLQGEEQLPQSISWRRD